MGYKENNYIFWPMLRKKKRMNKKYVSDDKLVKNLAKKKKTIHSSLHWAQTISSQLDAKFA